MPYDMTLYVSGIRLSHQALPTTAEHDDEERDASESCDRGRMAAEHAAIVARRFGSERP